MERKNRYPFASLPKAPVAQLDRVLPSEGRGRGFESRRVRHTPHKARLARALSLLQDSVGLLALFRLALTEAGFSPDGFTWLDPSA